MKKLIITMMLGITALTCVGVDTRSADEFRALFNRIMACTNNWERYNMAKSNHFFAIETRRDLDSLRLEFDSILADNGFGNVWSRTKRWPKMSALSREKNNMNQYMTNLLAIAKKYDVELIPSQFDKTKITMKERLIILNDYIQMYLNLPSVDMSTFNTARKLVQNGAEKYIKRWLRSQGKSFITKNGVNPCLEYINELTAALNAPRFKGLDEWIKKMNIDMQIDLSSLPTEEEIAKLKEDILVGEKNMNEKIKRTLEICLGVEEYNKFVKQYNGD